MPAVRDGAPVMLKLTSEPDEIRGGGLLAWWMGRSTVQVLEREKDALLMERPSGTRSLLNMAIEGQDAEAVDILCSVVATLHLPGSSPLPPLQPIETFFEPLLDSEWEDPIVQTGRRFASELLLGPIDLVTLHGDIQHYNVLDAGNGRWVAIDPKGLYGDRTYDYVNLFRNPLATFATDPAVFSRRIAQIEQHAHIDPRRLSQWIVAFCALCLVWDYYPEGSSDADRELAGLALSRATAPS